MVGSLNHMHFTAPFTRGVNFFGSASCIIESPCLPQLSLFFYMLAQCICLQRQQQHHALLTNGMHALYTYIFIYDHRTSPSFFFAVPSGAPSTLPSLVNKPQGVQVHRVSTQYSSEFFSNGSVQVHDAIAAKPDYYEEGGITSHNTHDVNHSFTGS